jgi:hypothetical protein
MNMDIQFVVGVITIIASMYGMLKFMLKDVHKEVEMMKEDQKEFKKEMRIVNSKFDAMQNRLDGLYRVLLDKTYGKNIPEELK